MTLASVLGKAAPAAAPARPGHLAWWREVPLLLACLLTYDLVRLLADGDSGPATRHAYDVLGAERSLHLDVEAALNAATADLRWAEVASSFWYASMHYVVTPLVLVLLYRARPQAY